MESNITIPANGRALFVFICDAWDACATASAVACACRLHDAVEVVVVAAVETADPEVRQQQPRFAGAGPALGLLAVGRPAAKTLERWGRWDRPHSVAHLPVLQPSRRRSVQGAPCSTGTNATPCLERRGRAAAAPPAPRATCT
jgi:hypothetical protein